MTRLLNQFFAVRVRHGGFARLLVFVACIIPVFDRLGVNVVLRRRGGTCKRSERVRSIGQTQPVGSDLRHELAAISRNAVSSAIPSINLFTNLAVTGIMQSVTAPVRVGK